MVEVMILQELLPFSARLPKMCSSAIFSTEEKIRYRSVMSMTFINFYACFKWGNIGFIMIKQSNILLLRLLNLFYLKF